jgi:hypothetical protein
MNVTGESSLRDPLRVARERPPQILLASYIPVFNELQYQLLPRKLGHGALICISMYKYSTLVLSNGFGEKMSSTVTPKFLRGSNFGVLLP